VSISAVDSERYVIGAMLQDGDAAIIALDALNVDDFYEPFHGMAFKSMAGLSKTVEHFDAATVLRQLERDYPNYTTNDQSLATMLLDCIDTAYATANVEYHIGQVRDATMRRRLLLLSEELRRQAMDAGVPASEVLRGAEDAVSRVAAGDHVGLVGIAEVVKESEARVLAIRADGRELVGLPTGYVDLDRMCGGAVAGELLLICGRPGSGKTSLGLNIALHIASCGHPGAVFSLEMTAFQSALRWQSMLSGVNGRDAMTRNASARDLEMVGRAWRELEKLPIYLDQRSHQTPSTIRMGLRRLNHVLATRGLGRCRYAVVDYAQFMGVDRDDARLGRPDQLSAISKGLLQIGKDLELCMIVCTQLKRRDGAIPRERRPSLDDIGGSDGPAKDAHVVIGLWQEEGRELQDGRKVVNVASLKVRNGKAVDFQLAFDGRTQRFSTLGEADTLSLTSCDDEEEFPL